MTSENSRIQEEIIKYLPGKDILKIMQCLDDPNICNESNNFLNFRFEKADC